MSVKMRQEIEKKIVSKLVDDALKAGYRIGVSLDRGYDVDEMLLGSDDREAIIKEALAGDECHLFIQEANEPFAVEAETTPRERLYGGEQSIKRVASIGWVFLVMGNDGWDVISDYTTNLDRLGLMKGADELAEAYS